MLVLGAEHIGKHHHAVERLEQLHRQRPHQQLAVLKRDAARLDVVAHVRPTAAVIRLLPVDTPVRVCRYETCCEQEADVVLRQIQHADDVHHLVEDQRVVRVAYGCQKISIVPVEQSVCAGNVGLALGERLHADQLTAAHIDRLSESGTRSPYALHFR